MHWRRGLDAEVVAWDRQLFEKVDAVQINHEDLIGRYEPLDAEFASKFKRGNVGLIVLLKHKATGGSLVVVNSHLHWNPKFDFVKYGQAFWLLKSTAEFLEARNMVAAGSANPGKSKSEVAVIMCGD